MLLTLVITILLLASYNTTLAKTTLKKSLNDTVKNVDNNKEKRSVKLLINAINNTVINTTISRTTRRGTAGRRASSCRRCRTRGTHLTTGERTHGDTRRCSSSCCSSNRCCSSSSCFSPAGSNSSDVSLTFNSATSLSNSVRRVSSDSSDPCLRVHGIHFISASKSGRVRHKRRYDVIFRVCGGSSIATCGVRPDIARATAGKRVTVSPDVLVRDLTTGGKIGCATQLMTSGGVGSNGTCFVVALVVSNRSINGNIRFSVPAGGGWCPPVEVEVLLLVIDIVLYKVASTRRLAIRAVGSLFAASTIQKTATLPGDSSCLRPSGSKQRVVRCSFGANGRRTIVFSITGAVNTAVSSFSDCALSPSNAGVLVTASDRPVCHRSVHTACCVCAVRDHGLRPLSSNNGRRIPVFSGSNGRVTFIERGGVCLIGVLCSGTRDTIAASNGIGTVVGNIPS